MPNPIYSIEISRLFASPDPRFSIQTGWDEPADWVLNAEAEAVLNLAHQGGHQHKLVTGNKMQTIHVKEWYDWYNPLYDPDIGYNALTWNKTTGAFVYPGTGAGAAAAWVLAEHNAGRHHTYIIGNEPDLGYDSGGMDMDGAQMALMHYTAAILIRANCPDAFIMPAGWANGLGSGNFDMEPFLSAHHTAHGTLDADAITWHVYQGGTYNDSYPVNKLNAFSEKAREWKAKGWTSTDKIVLTEFGWGGSTSADDCIAFMNWFVPYLKANPQVSRWHWWHYHGVGNILTDSPGTAATTLGTRYKELATNS